MKRINDLPAHPGVYIIKNVMNNKVYVGSSANVKRRRNLHMYELSNGIHHCRHLQNAFNKYGENSFEFLVVKTIDKIDDKDKLRKNLVEAEQLVLDAIDNGMLYNTAPIAESCLGIKKTPLQIEEMRTSRLKIRDYLSKMMNSPKYKKLLHDKCSGKNNAMYGKTHTSEAKKKMHLAMQERLKNGWIAPFRGRTHTHEAKIKIGLASKGRKKKPETIERFKIIFANGNNPNAKLVDVYDSNMNFLFKCSCIKEAFEKTHVSVYVIRKIAQGRQRQSRGFVFKFSK